MIGASLEEIPASNSKHWGVLLSTWVREAKRLMNLAVALGGRGGVKLKALLDNLGDVPGSIATQMNAIGASADTNAKMLDTLRVPLK